VTAIAAAAAVDGDADEDAAADAGVVGMTYLPPVFRHKPLARLGVVRQVCQHDLAVFQTAGFGLATSYGSLELVFVFLDGEIR